MSFSLLRSHHPFLSPILDVVYPPVCACCKEHIKTSEQFSPSSRKGSLFHTLTSIKVYLKKRLLCPSCLSALKEEEIIYKKGSHCASCGRFAITSDLAQICIACIDNRPAAHLRLRSVYYYLATSRQLIHQIKYKEKIEIANIVLLDLITTLPDMFLPGSRYYQPENKGSGLSWDLVTFVPSSQKNIKRRGFYSTFYITRKLSHLLGIPLVELVLDPKRQSDTPRSWLPRHRRNEEIPEFKLRNAPMLQSIPQPTKVLLIDDVITTGGSIIGALKTLKEINPFSIDVVSIAQSKHLHRYLLK